MSTPSRRPRLFNTVLRSGSTANLESAVRKQPLNIAPGALSFKALPADLPETFDPRTPEGFPEDQRPFWFYVGNDGKYKPILSMPLDQAGCGSCWAFSTSSMFTDRIRIDLLRRYGQEACQKSRFFNLVTQCTGESGAGTTSGGVVNVKPEARYEVEVRDRISAYWTAGFAPKLTDTCFSSDLSKCTVDKCGGAAEVWRQSAKGDVPADLHKRLGRMFPVCLGCEGNHISMPLIGFTGHAGEIEKGAATISDYNLSDWACLFGGPAQRKAFCTPEFLQKGSTFPLPPLFKADRYIYLTSDDLRQAPKGIGSMEDWIKAIVYNYGPVTIGFSVYKSFMDFFTRDPTGVYAYEDFKADIAKDDGNEHPEGGHAVVVVGWGSVRKYGRKVPYWIVRNSWGPSWGDEGYFRFERSMDRLLAHGYDQRVGFEEEFGTVFFSPSPTLNDVPNDMEMFMMGPAPGRCTSMAERKTQQGQLAATCRCPRGFYPDERGECERIHPLDLPIGTPEVAPVGPAPGAFGVAEEAKTSKKWLLIVVGFILIVISAMLAALVLKNRKTAAPTAGVGAPVAAISADTAAKRAAPVG